MPITGDWVLRLDADEMLTPELGEEMAHVLPTLPNSVTGLFLRRRVYFMGRWMRWGGYYPKWFIRLFRTGWGRYEEITGEHIILADGKARRLNRNVYMKTPMFLRAFAYFCLRYFFLRGFLDGREGLIFHFLQSLWYRFYVDAKTYEARKFGIDRAKLRIEYTGSKRVEPDPKNENVPA